MQNNPRVTQFESDANEVLRGTKLSENGFRKVQNRLNKEPDDLSARLLTLGFLRQNRSKEYWPNVLWLIQNHPAREIWTHIGSSLDCPEEWYVEGKKAWLQQISDDIENSNTVGNAGHWIIGQDFETGEKLLSRAMQLDPRNHNWPGKLNFEAYRKAVSADLSVRAPYLDTCLAAGDKFLENYDVDYSPLRASCLERCSWCSYERGDGGKARHYAEENIELTKAWSSPTKFCHSILGLVAIDDGDLTAAEQHLMTLTKDTFVDARLDLKLANKLLHLGRKSSVIKYFKKCKGLKKLVKYPLDDWIGKIEKGDEPNLL